MMHEHRSAMRMPEETFGPHTIPLLDDAFDTDAETILEDHDFLSLQTAGHDEDVMDLDGI